MRYTDPQKEIIHHLISSDLSREAQRYWKYTKV